MKGRSRFGTFFGINKEIIEGDEFRKVREEGGILCRVLCIKTRILVVVLCEVGSYCRVCL